MVTVEGKGDGKAEEIETCPPHPSGDGLSQDVWQLAPTLGMARNIG